MVKGRLRLKGGLYYRYSDIYNSQKWEHGRKNSDREKA